MDVAKAKSEVIEAGLELVRTGLIARTWGNVSCRIDDKTFAITPSGMAYETLRPEDIVVVRIDDLTYEGSVKPSSEKGIHASVYARKPEIGFVIHTHQDNASVAGVLGKDIPVRDPVARTLLGENVLLAEYGLPGTKKLRKNVDAAVLTTTGTAVLMAHHGALCFGKDRAEAFRTAQLLETVCDAYIVRPDVAASVRPKGSLRTETGFLFDPAGEAIHIDLTNPPALNNKEIGLHLVIYQNRPDINAILPALDDAIVAVSAQRRTIHPLLDDLAQIVGPSVRAAALDRPAQVVSAIRHRDAVLLNDAGALALGQNEDEAKAVILVLEKGCKAHLAAQKNGFTHAISPLETRLMRFVYKKKYSKLKK